MNYASGYDVIIIGGSNAGLSAAMTLGRSLREVLIIDSGEPCNRQTPHSHNFLFGDGSMPTELSRIAREAVLAYPTIKFLTGKVTDAHQRENGFEVRTANGLTFRAQKLLFATGMRDVLPEIKGLAECWGISALHCPYCHGYEVRNKHTAILASGEVAFELGKLIHHWTQSLTIFTGGPHGLSEEQFEKLRAKQLLIREERVLEVVHENGHLNTLILESGESYAVEALYLRAAMQQHCSLPVQLGCHFTESGHLSVDEKNETNVKGVFAAGDCTEFFRTVSIAIATGTKAAAFINRELINEAF